MADLKKKKIKRPIRLDAIGMYVCVLCIRQKQKMYIKRIVSSDQTHLTISANHIISFPLKCFFFETPGEKNEKMRDRF